MRENLASDIRSKADTWEKIGQQHPSYCDKELVRLLREAAFEIDSQAEEQFFAQQLTR